MRERTREDSLKRSNQNYATPTVEEVETYLKQQQNLRGIAFDTALEAEKFYNHYESADWCVGGTPIANWKNKANLWIIRIKSGEFAPPKSDPSPSPTVSNQQNKIWQPENRDDFSFLDDPLPLNGN